MDGNDGNDGNMTHEAGSPASGLKEATPALGGRSLKDPGVAAPPGWPMESGNSSNSNTPTPTHTEVTGYGSSRSEATTVASRQEGGHDGTSQASYPFLPGVVQEVPCRSLPKRFGKAQALHGMVHSLQVKQSVCSKLAPSSSKLCRLARGNEGLPTIDAASLAGLKKILEQVKAHFSSLSISPTPPVLFRHNNFYTPCSLEVCLGQKVELWPLVSHPPGCCFVVVPKLPLGLVLDERSGLVHGRPREPTAGQVKYHVVAQIPARSPPKAHVAFIKLTVIEGWPASDDEGSQAGGASSCD